MDSLIIPFHFSSCSRHIFWGYPSRSVHLTSHIWLIYASCCIQLQNASSISLLPAYTVSAWSRSPSPVACMIVWTFAKSSASPLASVWFVHHTALALIKVCISPFECWVRCCHFSATLWFFYFSFRIKFKILNGACELRYDLSTCYVFAFF